MKRAIREAIEQRRMLALDGLPEMLTTPEAARVLRMTVAGMKAWRRFRLGPSFVRLSRRRVIYPKTAIESFLGERLTLIER